MSVYGLMGTSASGMAAQADRMGAVADNIANVSTVGYKTVGVDFSTLIPEASQRYESSTVRSLTAHAISQQGNFDYTDSSTDLAINGNGFFVVSAPSGQVALTRAGSFSPDAHGELKNTAGFKLLGYNLLESSSTVIVNGAAGLEPINIEMMSLRAMPSSEGSLSVNLPAQTDVVPAANLPSTNQSAVDFSAKTSLVAYDNLGGEVVLDLYFAKAAGSQWEISVYDRSAMAAGGNFPASSGPLSSATLLFDTATGGLSSASAQNIDIPIPNGLSLNLDLSQATQLDAEFAVQNADTNGNKPFLLAGIACSDNYLSDETKAAVIPIGLFILREVDRVRLGNSASIDIICEVNAAIAEGLACAKPRIAQAAKPPS